MAQNAMTCAAVIETTREIQTKADAHAAAVLSEIIEYLAYSRDLMTSEIDRIKNGIGYEADKGVS